MWENVKRDSITFIFKGKKKMLIKRIIKTGFCGENNFYIFTRDMRYIHIAYIEYIPLRMKVETLTIDSTLFSCPSGI